MVETTLFVSASITLMLFDSVLATYISFFLGFTASPVGLRPTETVVRMDRARRSITVTLLLPPLET